MRVTRSITIDESELTERFILASGPGGQNVNKVASAVQLRFDLHGTATLTEAVKSRVRALAGRRLTDDGAILIIARNHRTQEANRREASDRLADLIRTALIPPKPRKKTKPTRASKQRRLDSKAHKQRTKGLRSKVRWD